MIRSCVTHLLQKDAYSGTSEGKCQTSRLCFLPIQQYIKEHHSRARNNNNVRACVRYTCVCSCQVRYDMSIGQRRRRTLPSPRRAAHRYRLGFGLMRNSRRIKAARWVSAKETRHEVTDATRRSLPFSRARGATPLSHKEEKRTPARHFSWRRLEQGSIWPEGGWPSMVVARRAFALSLSFTLSPILSLFHSLSHLGAVYLYTICVWVCICIHVYALCLPFFLPFSLFLLLARYLSLLLPEDKRARR